MGAGRPTIYSDELAESICEALSSGESLVTICAADDMPGMRTVLRWVNEREDFGAKYAHAREAQGETMDHKILTVADGSTAATAASDRVKIDAYKWRAAKLAPKRYGENSKVEVDGSITHRLEEVTQSADDFASRVARLVARGASGSGTGEAELGDEGPA